MTEQFSKLKRIGLIDIAPAERVRVAGASKKIEITIIEQLAYMADHLDEMSRTAFEVDLETLGGLLRLARDEARLQREASLAPAAD